LTLGTNYIGNLENFERLWNRLVKRFQLLKVGSNLKIYIINFRFK